MLKHSCLSVCVCVHVCPFIDVCEGPSRGAKSKASGHNWVIGTGDGLKHGLGDAAATLGCLRCQGQSALINRLGPYITALVVLAARSRQALWDFSLRQATFLSFPSGYFTEVGMVSHFSFRERGEEGRNNQTGQEGSFILCFKQSVLGFKQGVMNTNCLPGYRNHVPHFGLKANSIV